MLTIAFQAFVVTAALAAITYVVIEQVRYAKG